MPSAQALIVVDMLTDYEYEDGEKAAEQVERVLPTMTELIGRAREQGVPVIYVNDSAGDWRSDRRAFLDKLLEAERAHLVEPIVPDDAAPLIMKARHSIFYETQLEYLLRSEEIGTVCLIGQVTEQCILYSALDAHIRHIETVIPRDAVAHIDEGLAEAALRMMELNMEAAVTAASDVEFEAAG
jgi:nicotinamidase-related amidase